jgi:hypothetical protein
MPWERFLNRVFKIEVVKYVIEDLRDPMDVLHLYWLFLRLNIENYEVVHLVTRPVTDRGSFKCCRDITSYASSAVGPVTLWVQTVLISRDFQSGEHRKM